MKDLLDFFCNGNVFTKTLNFLFALLIGLITNGKIKSPPTPELTDDKNQTEVANFKHIIDEISTYKTKKETTLYN